MSWFYFLHVHCCQPILLLLNHITCMLQNFKGSENFIHKTSLKKFNEFTHCLCDSYNGTASCLLQDVICISWKVLKFLLACMGTISMNCMVQILHACHLANIRQWDTLSFKVDVIRFKIYNHYFKSFDTTKMHFKIS